MADDFHFDKKEHVYTLNGKPMMGCTSVLSVIAKPALIGWAADCAVDLIEAEVTDAQRRPHGFADIKWPQLFKAARVAHRRKKEAAGEAGTDLHALIEEYVRHCIATNHGHATFTTLPAIDAFMQWATKQNIRFLATEQRLYSKELWVAGTCDLIFEKDGKRYIGDIKTYKKLWDRIPMIQCAGYSIMFEEMNTVFSHPNGDTMSKQIHGYCVIRIKDDFEVQWCYDPDTDRKLFIAAVELYKGLQNWHN